MFNTKQYKVRDLPMQGETNCFYATSCIAHYQCHEDLWNAYTTFYHSTLSLSCISCR